MQYLIYLVLLTLVDQTRQIGIPVGGLSKYLLPKNETEHQPKETADDSKTIVIKRTKMNSSHENSSVTRKVENYNSVTVNMSSVSKSTQDSVNNEAVKSNENTEIDSGAITRGFLVIMGIGLLFFSYVAIKTCRRKGQDKSKVMVRKYGVRTNRTDVEMEPLPLSDDDEDDTLFDLTTSRSDPH